MKAKVNSRVAGMDHLSDLFMYHACIFKGKEVQDGQLSVCSE